MKKLITIFILCFVYLSSNPVFAEQENGFSIKFKSEQSIKANVPTQITVQHDATSNSNSAVAVYVECWTKDYTNNQAHLFFRLKKINNREYSSLIKFPTADDYFVRVHFEGNLHGTLHFKVKVQ